MQFLTASAFARIIRLEHDGQPLDCVLQRKSPTEISFCFCMEEEDEYGDSYMVTPEVTMSWPAAFVVNAAFEDQHFASLEEKAQAALNKVLEML